MNVKTTDILPGLLPFKPTQQSAFFGRTRQVYDLLSIMQSSKFVGLVGQAGSGKSSLVLAGLIPALQKGFDGVAGKQWTIAYSRVGTTPIENLAAGLAEENVLTSTGKSSLEFQQEIVRQIRRDHSGLLRVVSDADMGARKNLLIVLDQFEDIFQYAELSKKRHDQWDLDISLLVNNLARAVAATNAPIYVMIVLRASFLPQMYNFRSLQEYFNAGLYALPLLRQDDLQLIIREPLKLKGLQLTSEAAQFLEKGYDQNARNLPFLQLHIQRIVRKRMEEYERLQTEAEEGDVSAPARTEQLQPAEETITLNQVVTWGDITHGVAQDLEQFYLALPGHDKVLMQEIFKLITKPGVIPEIRLPQTFRHILEVTDIPRIDLKKFFVSLETQHPAVLEFIQPYSHRMEHFNEDYLTEETIINISNPYLVQHWARLHQWIDEERESRDTYLNLSERALLFEQGKAGHLLPPDLDVISQWYDREVPKKVWADQFNTIYRMAVDYLLKSREQYQLALEKKELERKREMQRIKKQRFYVMVFAGIMALIMIYAFFMKEEADDAKREAIKAAKSMEVERALAVKAEKVASRLSVTAAVKTKEALASAESAKQARQDAFEQRDLASKKADSIKKIQGELENTLLEAKRLKDVAIDRQRMADSNARKATRSEERANNSRDLISAKSRIVTLLNRLSSESLLTPESRRIFVDSLINSYNDYVKFSEKVNGRITPFNELYRLLTNTDWKVVEAKSSLSSSERNVFSAEAGLRDVDVFGGMAIAGGDDQKLVLYRPGKKIDTFATQQNSSRIRSIRFVDESSVIFSNVSGELYLFNWNSKSVKDRERRIAVLDDKILPSIFVRNGNVFTINRTQLTQVNIQTGAKKVIPSPQGVLQVMAYPEERLLLKTAKQVLIFDPRTGTSVPLALPGQVDVKSISSAAYAPNYTFFGTDDGRLYICSAASGNSISFIGQIKAHATKITALLFDKEVQQLITASLDNKAKIYDISTDRIESWEESVQTLEGFRKWIWDMELIQSGDQTELLTVDEGGELFRWSTRSGDLFQHIQNWRIKNKGK